MWHPPVARALPADEHNREVPMNSVRARDIMSTALTVVAPKTGIDKIALLMSLKMISAVPVVDEAFHLLGLVSEGDLLLRDESGTLPRTSWWLKWFSDSASLAREYAKTHGLTAEDVMVRQVVCVGPDTTADQIADIMRRRGIKRVPVVEDGKLVGIVSRADIVQMVALRNAGSAGAPRTDNDIQDEVMKRLREEPWVTGPPLSVVVRQGVVELSGLATSKDEQAALSVLVRGVPGVTDVKDLTRIVHVPGA